MVDIALITCKICLATSWQSERLDAGWFRDTCNSCGHEREHQIAAPVNRRSAYATRALSAKDEMKWLVMIGKAKKPARKRKVYDAAKWKGLAKRLRSADWREFAASIRSARGFKCETCGSGDKLHVHHKHYRTLGRETPNDVALLCKACHEKVHGRKIW